MIHFIIGLMISFIISFTAYKKSSLNFSGFLAAVVLGTGIYFFGGFWFYIIMLSFFISSSLLTKYKKDVKENIENLNEKNGARDYVQVFVNGGIGLVCAVLFHIYDNPIYFLSYGVSFAVSTADTWASEIGVLSKSNPLSILNFKPIEKGLSGGVTILGTMFSILGSGFIALIFFIAYISMYNNIEKGFICSLLCLCLGFLGSIIDSILGASVQAQYYCEPLKSYTEKKTYKDKQNKLIKGFSIINNDVVNFVSNLLSTVLVFIFM